MTNRVVLGALPGGGAGLRVARPGYDVFAEPIGSPNINFDSRLIDFGIIHAQGIMGATITVFPALSYIPVVSINRIDPNGRILSEDVAEHVAGTARHWFLPYVATVTNASLRIQAFSNPYYSPVFPPGVFMYTVFRIKT